MYRQPYRITMAEWDFSVYQKRILSGIVYSLQNEIALVEKGLPPSQLPLFQQSDKWVQVEVPMKLLLPKGKNHHMVHRALELFNQDATILLPEIKGRKGLPVPESRVSLYMQKMPSSPLSRNLRLRIGWDLAFELVRTSSGLTTLSWDTFMAMRGPHSIRLYELASHWKDLETMSVQLDRFRRWIGLFDSFRETREMMRKVVRPAERQLERVSEVYVHCEPVKRGRCIVQMNLHIRQKRRREEEDAYHMRLKEQITNILRMHFRFREEHFRQIEGVMRNGNRLKALNEKIGMLWGHLDKSKGEVKDVTLWALTSIRNAFPD